MPPDDAIVEDAQAQPVYDAERAMWRRMRRRILPLTLAELSRSANRVVDSRWWFARYGPLPWPIRCRSLPFSADWDASAGEHGCLYFAPKHRNEYVLAHELAHLAADCQPHHGPRFARAYLDLARFLLGEEAARALTLELHYHRVKLAPARAITPPAEIAAEAA